MTQTWLPPSPTGDSTLVVDASAGSEVVYLPAGFATLRRQTVRRTDGSGNTVTVCVPSGGKINGVVDATLLIGPRGSAAFTAFDANAWVSDSSSVDSGAVVDGSLTAVDLNIPSVAQAVAADPSVSGTYVRVGETAVNAANYGNDVNLAMAALPSGGGKVYITAQETLLTANISVQKPNITLEGVWGFWGAWTGSGTHAAGTGTKGIGPRVTAASGAVTKMINLDSSLIGGGDPRLKGIQIRNLYLYGYNYTGVGISATDSGAAPDQLIIENVFVHHTNNGMDINADAGHIRHNTVMDCAGFGIQFGNVGGGVYGVIEDNVVADIGGNGIVVSNQNVNAQIKNNSIVRCVIGIRALSSGADISGNALAQNRDDSILVQGADCSVVNNKVESGDGHGIYVATSGNDNAVIIGNRVGGVAKESIITASTTGHIVQGNLVKVSQTGFDIMSFTGANGSVITGNKVIQVSGSNTNRGIYVEGTTTPMILTENMVTGTITTKISAPAHNGTTLINANNMTS